MAILTTVARPTINTIAVRTTATANTVLISPPLTCEPVAPSTVIVITAAGQLPMASKRAIRHSTVFWDRWTIVPNVFVMRKCEVGADGDCRVYTEQGQRGRDKGA